MKANFIHLTGGFVGATLSVLALALGWPALISIMVVAVANLYMFVFFVECGLRSSDRISDYPKPKKILHLPARILGPLQLFFLSFVFIPGFANLYIHTNAVQHLVSDKPDESYEQSTNELIEQPETIQPEYLTNAMDAFYYSFVTITMLGYGDYVPVNTVARFVVVWELITTVQLVLFGFPLIISRLGDY